MSILIPVWQLSLGNSQQTTSESDKSDDKSDESESSTGETGTVKSPNTDVTVFLYIYMMKNVNNMTPESASAYVGNMMMESGGVLTT